MKIIAYETSRLTALFPFEEVVPLAGVNDRQIIEGIANRYKFLKSPNLVGDEVAKNGYKFEAGQFTINNEIERITDFAIYRDGAVINTPRTETAEAFLDDIVQFMKTEFQYRDFITPPRRYFQSQVVVEFSRSPAKLMGSIDAIMSIISEPLTEIYGTNVPMQFSRIDFEFDKTNIAVRVPVTVHRFSMERRLAVPFENERYFCSAPTRTNTHIEMLEKIEALVD